MLASAGFQVRRIASYTGHLGVTHVAELACDPRHYRCFLTSHELPPRVRRLIISNEHAAAQRSGGIGRYVQRRQEADGERETAALLVQLGQFSAKDKLTISRSYPVFFSDDLAAPWSARTTCVDAVYDSVSFLLFLYPAIEVVEIQDYGGFAWRVAQAFDTGLFPGYITFNCVCHGNNLYFELSTSRFLDEGPTHFKERVCVELADRAVFPTNYLKGVYEEIGGYRPKASVVAPLTIPDRSEHSEEEFGPVSRIVFFGKLSRMKGFDHFLAAIERLREYSCFSQIKAIDIIAHPGDIAPPDWSSIGVAVSCRTLEPYAVSRYFAQVAHEAICALPYPGDNYPLSVIEAINSEIRIVAYRAGGIPEIIPLRFHAPILVDPNADSLAKKLKEAIECDPSIRKLTCVELKLALASEMERRSANFLCQVVDWRKPKRSDPGDRDFDLVITYFRETSALLRDCIASVTNSLVRPKRIILVDDGSGEEYGGVIHDIAAMSEIPVEVVTIEQNGGLAAARNRGLDKVSAPYVMFVDSDDLVCNELTYWLLKAANRHPTSVGVACGCVSFHEDQDFSYFQNLEKTWLADGPDVARGLSKNVFGMASGLFRTSKLREIGGYDGSSRATYEDWALWLRIAVGGDVITFCPIAAYLYRVRRNSMSRTYPEFAGHLRLADSLSSVLPRRDAIAFVRSALAERQSATPAPQDAIVQALLPKKLRSRQAQVDAVTGKLVWWREALKSPFNFGYWNSIRMLRRRERRYNAAGEKLVRNP
jgi:glycosyltransferase involved in cell wall biosynthesis